MILAPTIRRRENIKQSAAVLYTVAVLDAAGREVRRLPRKRNLILDQGLNAVAARSWVANITHAAVGTGTTPTKRDSGAITFSRAGSVITASANFFDVTDVGRLFKFDSGEEAYITAFTDAQNVTVSIAGTVAASEGTVWYVNQTGLAVESKRTNTYGSDSGDNGSTFVRPSWTFKRTFIFSVESGSVTYQEIGWSHTATAANNLFGRDLISGGVSLIAGQQLKVILELVVTLSPSESTAWSNVITGWSQDGNHGIECCSLDSVAPAAPGTPTGSGVLEPSNGTLYFSLSTSTTALQVAQVGSISPGGVIGARLATGREAYVPGNFYVEFKPTWGPTIGNSASIRSIFLDYSDGSNFNRSIYRVLLAAAETKAGTHKLELTFRFSWQRTLVN